MKYLIIVGLVALVLAFVYRRLRPYILAIQNFMNVASNVINQEGAPPNSKGQNKLIRCVSCGTWIPAARAIGAGRGASQYCSTDCLEKPKSEGRKISGVG